MYVRVYMFVEHMFDRLREGPNTVLDQQEQAMTQAFNIRHPAHYAVRSGTQGRVRLSRPHAARPGGSCSRTAGRRRLAPSVYRRRRVAAVAIAMMSFAGLGALLADPFGAVPAGASDRTVVAEPTTIIAQPGDTIWALAHRHRGSVDHGRFVEMLIAANGGPSLQVGQQVVIP